MDAWPYFDLSLEKNGEPLEEQIKLQIKKLRARLPHVADPARLTRYQAIRTLTQIMDHLTSRQ